MDLQEQYNRLLRYCYMKTRDKCVSEDIVQETFLRFWQSNSYKDTGKELAYLYTIARNLCIDETRKVKTEDFNEYSEMADLNQIQADDIIEKLVIEQALDKLQSELREIIILRFNNELSVADIGKIMHMSRFAVNRRVKEGLKILRKYLEKEDERIDE